MALGSRVLGLCFAFLNTALSSVGFILQRKAQLMSERGLHSKQPLRLIGIVLYILAALPDVVAYTLIPQVLCATVACFRLVVVCVMGHVFLEEHLQDRDKRSIVICTLGTLLCVIFGPGGEEHPSGPPSSTDQIYHPKVVAYTIVGLGLLIVFLVIVHADSFGWLLSSSKLYRYSLPVATALAYAVEKVYNTELGFVQMPPNILREPTWLCMVAAVALLGLTDFYLNVRAAERMPVHLFVPLSFAFGTSLQCFQAMVIFDEFVDMTFFCSTMTLLGAALSLVGALLIQPPQFEAEARQRATSLASQGSASPANKSKTDEALADGWNAWKARSVCARRLAQTGWAVCQQAQAIGKGTEARWRHLKKSRSQELHLV